METGTLRHNLPVHMCFQLALRSPFPAWGGQWSPPLEKRTQRGRMRFLPCRVRWTEKEEICFLLLSGASIPFLRVFCRTWKGSEIQPLFSLASLHAVLWTRVWQWARGLVKAVHRGFFGSAIPAIALRILEEKYKRRLYYIPPRRKKF